MREQHEIIDKFKRISSKGWIKGVNNTTNSVGLTFESLISKKPDSMYFPDYHGIEIKCSQRFSRYPIKLFTLAFDGPMLYEMNRILEKYGRVDRVYKGRKQLQGYLYINKYQRINNNYFKIKLDKINQKIILCVYDLNYQLIEALSYIDFQTIKERLELKLSKLAIVYASKKIIDKHPYFRYYLITIYKLKSFEMFIELLENNYIQVEISGRVSRSGVEKGRQRNKNIVFSIPKEHVDLLYNKIFIYNSDLQ
jgi:hypothetical protein